MSKEEPIIIDGVDVSECLFYQSNFEEDYDVKIKHFCSNWHNSCESANNSNCYYKQLARKTQECDIWKNQVLVLDEESVTVQVTQEQFEEYQKLKQECEKLSILAQEESARNAYIEYELNDKLKQKTQELYFARNEIHSKTEYIQEQRDIIDQLKQECEEQKTIISTLKYIIKYQEDQLYRHHELVLKMASSDDEL